MRDICDLEPWSFYAERLVRARRAYRCCETDREIQPGEWHWVCRGHADDRWETFRQSWAAYRLARALNYDGNTGVSNNGHTCWIPFGGLQCEVTESEVVSWEEWQAVCRGVVTRDPVGDEARVVAARGAPMPTVRMVDQQEETEHE